MNKELLEDFTKFCTEHPQLRFWQALRAWAEVDYIYISTTLPEGEKLQDTFYFNEKNQ